MTQPGSAHTVWEFGVFELDLRQAELRRKGVRIPLQEQPLKLLGLLLAQAGQVVTREEIAERLWPGDAYGDLDHRLNNAVNRIRIALGDSAESPRFVETVPRRGYRFLASAREITRPTESGGPTTPSPLPEIAPSEQRRRSPTLILVTAALLLGVVSAWAVWRSAAPIGGPVPNQLLVAVLPFASIGGDPTREYLAEGLTEEIILQLGRTSPNLGVIARTSVMPYKGADMSISQIGEELGVDYILEGSVRQESDQLRITAQLVGVEQQTPLWSESYNRTLENVFTVQRDVAERASASLALAVLLPADPQGDRPPPSRAAHEAYLRARYFQDLGTEEGYHRAIDYFRLAVAEDPLYARAYAGLAGCQCLLAGHGLEVIPPDEAMPRARELADRALGIDSSVAEAQAVLGMVRLKYEWDFEGAEQSFLRALELNPSYAQAHFWYSLYLEAMGRPEEAVLQARRALELNPISQGASANLAMQLTNGERYDDAAAEIEKAMELNDSFWGIHWVLGNLLARQDDLAGATEAFQRAVELSNRNSVSLSSLGFAHASAGRATEAEAIIRELGALREARYVSPAFIAAIYAGLGELDAAFRYLEEAFELRSRYLVWLAVGPEYEPLRSDPRYRDLISRIGLGSS